MYTDSSRHSWYRSSTHSGFRTVEQAGGDSKELDDLQELVRSVIRKRSKQEECLAILEDQGFDTIQNLQDATVDSLKGVGLKHGHAHRIVREVQNRLPRPVRLRCWPNGPNVLCPVVKMSSTLHDLRAIVALTFQKEFVFMWEDTEIAEDQEFEPVNTFYGSAETSTAPTVQICFRNGKSLGHVAVLYLLY